MATRIFDTDHHVTPPPDMWTSRMPKKYQDIAPRVVDLPDGGQAWSFDGGAIMHLFGLENVGGREPTELSWKTHYDELPKSYYEPQARLEAMDRDGIDVALLFPSVAGQAAAIYDDETFFAHIQAYNDGIWDWAQEGDAKRMLPAAHLPNRGVEMTMQELDRVVKKGFVHFQYTGSPSGSPLPVPGDDPFWAMVQETGIVVSMHGGSSAGRPKPKAPAKASPAPPVHDQEMIAAMRSSGLGAQTALGVMILSGVLERFPKLKVSLIETSTGWLPQFLNQLDAVYTQHRWLGEQKLSRLPSEYAKQVLIGVDREIQGIKHRHQVGVDNITFGTDYPHIGSFWPHTRFYIDLLFDGVPEDEREKILWSNAATMYGVN